MNIRPEKNITPFKDQLESVKQELSLRKRFPLSTYRLQLNRQFDFDAARSIVDYLSRLGITHCYASPYLAAGKDSPHGYDITDYTRINPELGGEPGLQQFAAELSRFQMGHILDFVPNHMGIDGFENQWWQDVLENGLCSPHAEIFDIDWNPGKAELRGKILLPILGDPYGVVLDRGELELKFHDGEFYIQYFDNRLPVNPQSIPLILSHDINTLKKEIAEDDPAWGEFLSILTAHSNLPSTLESDPEKIQARAREKAVGRERLRRLTHESPRIREHVTQNVQRFNGFPGQPESFDLLHDLLEHQVYRLSNWRTAAHEINYRRFFDINHLAGIKMERPEVFEQTHVLILRLIGEGTITGLRLDHPDGLYNPGEYFDRLQEAVLYEHTVRGGKLGTMEVATVRELVRQWRQKERETDPTGPVVRPLYLVAEKILTGSESLPEHWAVHGTSGYDFMNEVNALFVDASREKQFSKIYARYTGNTAPFSEIVYQSKKLIIQTALTSELNVLVRALNLISEEHRHSRDFTLNSLREALTETVACFPIYRTYIDASGINPEDSDTLAKSIARARGKNPALEPTIFDFLKHTLIPESGENLPPAVIAKRRDFIMKLQQFTAPVQAKGLEDTAFYRYNRLLSLNEVGGRPQRFGLTPSLFHRRNQRRQKLWPQTLIATATHDHKRGEDVRARLNLLSEIPDDWRKALGRWSLINRGKRTLIDKKHAPGRNDEYLFYQTLLGMWPPGPAEAVDRDRLIERLLTYMHKAVKEAKTHTSWINPNEAYDTALTHFIEKTLAPAKSNRFLDSFLPFQERIARMGVVNSLAQVLLKISTPGIPDFFQGSELWDLSLVDPDNRQPVDFSLRQRFLTEMEPLLQMPPPDLPQHLSALFELLSHWGDGRIKMFVTVCGLRFRKRLPDLFLQGEYLPLQVEGERADHVVAFLRQHNGQFSLTAVPRLAAGLMQPDLKWPVGESVWKDTAILLPPSFQERSRLVDRFTHKHLSLLADNGSLRLPVKNVFSFLPLALLTDPDALANS